MKITSESMRSYMTQLSNINEKAKQEALKYIQDNNYDIDDGFIDFAHGLTTKYGEAAAELSCRMYDELHQYWKEAKKSTKSLLPAEPAEVPTRSDVEKAVYGTLKTSVNEIPGAVSRLVKQTAEDTKIKNGMRDGAEFAWIPAGDSCAFCLVLASRGWQRISKKTLKNGHAEHIHANCDCTYTVRFDSTTEVEGYDPELYRRMWDDADGKNAKEKMRNLRKEVRTDEFIGKYGLDNTSSALDVVETVIPKFVAATTKQEAETFARQFADRVTYEGMSLENANIINETINTLTAKYPVGQMEYLESTAKGRGVASASFRGIQVNGRKLGKILDGDIAVFEQNREVAMESIKIMEDRWKGKRMPASIQNNVEKLRNKLKFSRWGVHASYDDHVKVTIIHEYGHMLSDRYFGMINKERGNPNMATNWSIRKMGERWIETYKKALSSGDIYNISEYASTNKNEFFAECFAAREMGEKLPDYIEDLMREVLENGIMQ